MKAMDLALARLTVFCVRDLNCAVHCAICLWHHAWCEKTVLLPSAHHSCKHMFRWREYLNELGYQTQQLACACTLKLTVSICFKNRTGRISPDLNWVLKNCTCNILCCKSCPASSAELPSAFMDSQEQLFQLLPAQGFFPLHIFYLQWSH